MDPVYLNWRILAGAAPWLTMKQEHVRTATGTNECPAYMEALKAKGLSNKSTWATSRQLGLIKPRGSGDHWLNACFFLTRLQS
ncbi:hypothetical protein ACLKA6_017597 [Drosophila palustris]